MDNNEYSLYHYGIPGMRWGRRKGSSTSSSSNGKKKKSSTSSSSNGKKKKVDMWANNPGAQLLRGAVRAIGLKKLNDIAVSASVIAGNPALANASHLIFGVAGQTANQVYTIGKAIQASKLKRS